METLAIARLSQAHLQGSLVEGSSRRMVSTKGIKKYFLKGIFLHM